MPSTGNTASTPNVHVITRTKLPRSYTFEKPLNVRGITPVLLVIIIIIIIIMIIIIIYSKRKTP